MVQHILVAFDGSSSSRHAARFAFGFARQVKGKVTLLTVLPPPEVLPLGPVSGYAVIKPALTDQETAEMTARLNAMAGEYPDVAIDKRIEVGPVADTIIDVANSLGVDLIVVGARGLGPGRRFLVGSVSDRVVHHAGCPVTVWR